MKRREKNNAVTRGEARTITAAEVEEIGASLYEGRRHWLQSAAKDLGIEPGSVRVWKRRGAAGSQASALVGLISRRLHALIAAEELRRAEFDALRAEWLGYLNRFEARLTA